MHYEIHNYVNGNEYINIDSDVSDHNKIWTTLIPYNHTPDETNQPTKPFQFAKKSDATIVLDQIKNVRLTDWQRNEIQNKLLGIKKPAWKIYKIEL